MSPGISVPQGTELEVGSTKWPLEFWTLSFKRMETYKEIPRLVNKAASLGNHLC